MRKHYIDNIRCVTVLLVVLYHVIYMFNSVITEGVVGPVSAFHGQDVIQYLLYPWFMVILFLISGMSAKYYLDTHSVKEFVRARTRKLLVPSTIGLLVTGWMQGYYNMPEETAKVFTEDGWFKTGDLGWIDKENYLMLSGRVKNMIVTEGGKNVYPEEIEDAFQLETDIQQITVRGYIADEKMKSEELEALVYPGDELFAHLKIRRDLYDDDSRKAVEKAVSAIVERVNRRLQPYQRITRITILDEPLEMTTTLKVKRNYNS